MLHDMCTLPHLHAAHRVLQGYFLCGFEIEIYDLIWQVCLDVHAAWSALLQDFRGNVNMRVSVSNY
jgi:hypothetical protein